MQGSTFLQGFTAWPRQCAINRAGEPGQGGGAPDNVAIDEESWRASDSKLLCFLNVFLNSSATRI